MDEDLYLYRRHRESLTDVRARAIKAMVARLVLRESAAIRDRPTRARVLLKLVTDDAVTPRIGLLARAAAISPASTLRALPHLARWAGRVVLRRP